MKEKHFSSKYLILIIIIFTYLFIFSTTSLTSLPGDFCGPMGDPTPDGKVDFNDLMVFATAYGSQKGDLNWNGLCDICGYLGDPNPDDKVNFDDLMVFATNYGKEIETIIPEPTEAISQEIDLSIGGIVEVIDPENIIYGVKLIIPPIPSEKRGGKSTATMTISYIDNPYSLELPDNRGFLLPPVVINSDVTLDVKCTLEIPYTEADLNNMGLSSNENIIIYHYNYTSSSWEEVTVNKRSYKDKTDLDYIAEEKLIKIFYPPFGLDWMPEQMLEDSIYVCSYAEVPPSIDPGFPQPGDLLYRKSNVGGIDGWIPGHVGIYVGEKYGDHDDDLSTPDKAYNVIEALHKDSNGTTVNKVMANYYSPISEFAGKFNTTYMGARQPDSDFGALDSEERMKVLNYLDENDVVGKPYAWYETKQFLLGLARGKYVKGMFGDYNCVGLTEAAYEYAGINLVSDEDEGNNASDISVRAAFWPIEQYKETDPAEGYSVSGKVTDSQGIGILEVTINFELVSFNNYHDSFKLTTDSNGDWSSGKLGREWNVTPQKDGYTFEPSTIKVKEHANDINFTSTLVTPETYTITASAGPNGSIDPSGDVSINQGLDITFTITPDTGFQINDVLVDGSSEGAVSLHTFTNVTEDHSISATFISEAIGSVHNLTKNTYYDTIQAALNDADSGNTIEVADGTYTENIWIIKDYLTLKSKNGAEKTTIEAADGNNDTLLIKADYTYINGFTIEGAGTAGYYKDRRGGIRIVNSYSTISNNIISNNSQGIFMSSTNNNIISNNIISNNSIRGILLEAADYNTFSNNIIDSNVGAGIYVSAYYGLTGIYYSYSNTIINNTISNNGGGINISGGSGNLAYLNNVIDNNTNGSSSSLVTNPWNSPEEITYSYNGNTYTNYLGNYWGNYAGSDSNGDGIGDTPYIINEEQDNYPLMEPFENY
jgi:parallel beta-helix repeat protein